MTYRIMLLVELTKLSDMSDNFVVISWYNFVFLGNVFSNGTRFPEQRIKPLPAFTFVIYPNWLSEMFKSLANSSRSVLAWFSITKNSLFASISLAVSERRTSSTFWLMAFTNPLYFRIRFHNL